MATGYFGWRIDPNSGFDIGPYLPTCGLGVGISKDRYVLGSPVTIGATKTTDGTDVQVSGQITRFVYGIPVTVSAGGDLLVAGNSVKSVGAGAAVTLGGKMPLGSVFSMPLAVDTGVTGGVQASVDRTGIGASAGVSGTLLGNLGERQFGGIASCQYTLYLPFEPYDSEATRRASNREVAEGLDRDLNAGTLHDSSGAPSDYRTAIRDAESRLIAGPDGSREVIELSDGIRVVQTPAGPKIVLPQAASNVPGLYTESNSWDLTSQAARQIGIDAYSAGQQRIADERAEANREAAANRSSDNSHNWTSTYGAHTSGGNTSGGSGGNSTTSGAPYSNYSTTKTSWGSNTTFNGQQSYDRDHTAGTGYDHTATEDRRPIILDLNGNGIEITGLDRSTTFMDSADDGLQHRTAWAASGDGVLFFDADGDGKISSTREYVFTEWDPSAKDDMAALKSQFDSNKDGKLTSADADWAKFKLMVTNANGSQTAWVLSDNDTIAGNDLHISEINLTPDATHITLPDGSVITGQATFRMGGVDYTVANTTLVAEAQGYRLVQTLATDGAGTRTVVSTSYGLSGAKVSVLTSVTSSNGSLVTLSYDDNGDGVVDRAQKITVAMTDAAHKTETLVNYKGGDTGSGGVVLNKVVTVTNGATVTITRFDGSSTHAYQEEIRTTTAKHVSIVTHDLSDSGVILNSVTHVVSTDGLTRTDKFNFEGQDSNGAFATNTKVVHAISDIGTGGAVHVEDVKTFSQNNDLEGHQTTVTTSAASNGGLTVTTNRTILIDGNGDGITDSTELMTVQVVRDANNNIVTTTTDELRNGNYQLDLTSGAVTAIGATSRAVFEKVVQTESKIVSGTSLVDTITKTTTTDLNGDGQIDRTVTEQTIVRGNGTRDVSATVRSQDGTVLDTAKTTQAADRVGTETSVDLDHDGALEANEVVHSVALLSTLGQTGFDTGVTYNKVEKTFVLSSNATVLGQNVTLTTADGLTKLIQIDNDGDGVFETRIVDKTVNSSGVATETISTVNADGSLRGQTFVVTTADGLTQKTARDVNGDGSFDAVETVVVSNASGEITQTTKTYSGNAAGFDSNGALVFSTGLSKLLAIQVTIDSVDRLTETTKIDSDGDGQYDHISVVIKNADGSMTTTNTNNALSSAGTATVVSGQSVTQTSANGFKISTDLDGDTHLDVVRETVIFSGGTTQTTVTSYADGLRESQVQHFVSGNGSITTDQSDANGDGTWERSTTATTSTGSDGWVTTTTVEQRSDLSEIRKSAMATNDDGLTRLSMIDEDGDGDIDAQSITTTEILATGETKVTTAHYLDAGTNSFATLALSHGHGSVLLDSLIVTTTADQQTVTQEFDQDGDGFNDRKTTETTAADGTRTIKNQYYSDGDTVLGGIEATDTTTIFAGGLIKTIAVDRNNDGRVDHFINDVTELGSDGSTTRTIEHRNDRYVVLGTEAYYTSDDGLFSSATLDLNGDGVIESRSESRTEYMSNGDVKVSRGTWDETSDLLSSSTSLVSGNGLTTIETADFTGDGTIDRIRTLTKSADGAWVQVGSEFAPGGDTRHSTTETMSADGRLHVISSDLDDDGHFDRRVTAVVDASQDVTTTMEDLALDGSATKTIIAHTDTSGLHTEFGMDFDRDGVDDITRVSDISFKAAVASALGELRPWDSGAKVEVFKEVYADGRNAYLQTKTTAADGLKVTTTFDIDGDGNIDGSTTLTKSMDASGNRTVTEVTNYADGTNAAPVLEELRSSHMMATSADGRTVTIQDDFDGNGIYDKIDVTEIGPDGSRVETETSFGVGGMRGQTFVTATSADGLITTITRPGNIQTIAHSSVNNGSYVWDNGVTPSTTASHIVVVHDIDAFGIETWSSVDISQVQTKDWVRDFLWFGHTVTHTSNTTVISEARLDQAAKQSIFNEADRIYDAILDRGLDVGERELLINYVVGGQLNKTALSEALISSNEFAARYNAPDPTTGVMGLSTVEFVEQLYLNTFGRGAMLSEMSDALKYIQAGTTSAAQLALRGQFAIEMADSVEHGVVGNGHSATNNFDVIINPAVFERSLDRVFVETQVKALIDTVFDREPTASELSAFTNGLMKGTDTLGLIAARLIGSNSDTVGDHSHSLYWHTPDKSGVDDFVDQAFMNGLGRPATLDEHNLWVGMLGGSAPKLTWAQFVVAIAQSVDHDAAINLHNASEGDSRGTVQDLDTSSLNDTVTDGDGARSLFGWNGDDILIGNGGSDFLFGSSGDDTLYGGAGSDTYVWHKDDIYNQRDGDDKIYEYAGAPSDQDTLDLSQLQLAEVGFSRSGNDLIITVIAGGSIRVYGQFAGGVGGAGLEQIIFGSDTILAADLATKVAQIGGITGSSANDILTGGTQNESLTGGDGDDTISGGTGADTLLGGNGSDKYSWAIGDGNDTIDDGGASISEIDRLVLLGVNQSQVTLTRTANDMVIAINDASGVLNGTILVKNRFVGITNGSGIEVIQFADGAWSLNDFEMKTTSSSLTGTAYADNIKGDGGNQTLIGNAGADTLDGGAGNDTLQGGDGSDTYLWGKTSGASDQIEDTITAMSQSDHLKLTDISSSDFTSGMLALFRVYTDSTVTGVADSISNDLTIRYNDGTTNVSILVVDQFSSVTSGKGLEVIEFSDGVVWTLQDIITHTRISVNGTLLNSVVGSAFAENLSGSLMPDFISGGGGDDLLIGRYGDDSLFGGDGSDRFQWSRGDGSDVITDAGIGSGEVDTLALLDVTSASVTWQTFSQSDTSLALVINGTNGATITVANSFDSAGHNTGIEIVEFCDGVTSKVIDQALINTSGDASNNTLQGWAYSDLLIGKVGNDTLNGGLGEDTLNGGNQADSMDGGAGSDRYVWRVGDNIATDSGSDIVSDTGTSKTEVDILDLSNASSGAIGVNSTQVTLSRSFSGNVASKDLMIAFPGISGAGGINIVNQFGDITKGYGIEAIKFADGVIWQLDDILSHAVVVGSAGSDTINGGDFNDSIFGDAGADILSGGNGDDSINGGTGIDTLLGGAGSDKYFWHTGGGNDVITDLSSATGASDLLILMDVASSGVVLTRDNGSMDLKVSVPTASSLISITSQFLAASQSNGIEAIQFADGVTWMLDDIFRHTTLSGTSGNDTGTSGLIGTGFADNILGLEGDDQLTGRGGEDTLTGGIGDDLLTGDEANSTESGTAAGNDVYLWSIGDGNDTINDRGSDYAQVDTLDLSQNANSSLNVLSSAVHLTRASNSNDLIISIDDGNGTIAKLTVLFRYSAGASGPAASGIERITFADGSFWTLDDILDKTLVEGLSGNDVLNNTGYTGQRDKLLGYGGIDNLYGGDADDTLNGGAGADKLYGGNGADTADYSSATSTPWISIDLGQSTQTGTGGTNNEATGDILVSIENVIGTAAGDVIVGNTSANDLYGAGGNDSLSGSDGYDRLYGGVGNDTFVGQVGADFIDGGGDIDLVTYEAATAAIKADLANPQTNAGAADGDVFVSVENLTGSAYADTLSGDDSANTIVGNDGADFISGRDGNDLLDGGVGGDSLFGGLNNDSLYGGDGGDLLDGGVHADGMAGGAGDDTYVVDNTGDVVTESSGQGQDNVQSWLATYSLAAYVEDMTLVLGSSAISGAGNGLNNQITGNEASNILSGANGDDLLYGGSGNDTLNGESGNDSLVGGGGDDKYIIDAPGDTVSEASGSGVDLVESSITYTLGANVENLTLTSSGAVSGTGNALDNLITGFTGANTLSGGDGNDSLLGGAGNDSLIGGSGNDSLDGQSGNDSMSGGAGDDIYTVDSATDVVTESASSGTDIIFSSITLTVATNVENLTLTGSAAINATGDGSANTLNGSSGANYLSGLGAADILIGGAGNDSLQGGVGNDMLTGGTGADHFIYAGTNTGTDVIADFNELEGGSEEGDVLEFQGLLTGTFVFRGTSLFTGGSDNSEARVVGNQVQIDTNGDGTLDFAITLTGLTSASQLAGSDFLWN